MTQDFFSLFEGTDSAKNRFGMLRLYSTPCDLKAGAAYSLSDVLDAEGQPMVFKGKQPNPGSNRRHIVFALSQKNQEGQPYTAVRQWMSFDEEYKTKIKPALYKAVAELNLNPQPGQAIPVALEEVGGGGTYQASDGSTKERTIWIVTKVYASQAEMETAEATFWSSVRAGADGTGEASPVIPNGWKPESEGWDADNLHTIGPQLAEELKTKPLTQVAADYGMTIADALVALGEHRTKLPPVAVAGKYKVDVSEVSKVRDQASVIPF